MFRPHVEVPAAVASDSTPARGSRARVGVGLVVLVGCLVAAVGARIVWGSTTVPFEAVVDLALGRPVDPLYRMIVVDLRIPTAITACLAGAALGVAGLQMQTLFGNPLAEPYVLGVSSGATLGVATVLLVGPAVSIGWLGRAAGFTGSLGTTLAATLGAGLVMALVLLVGTFVRSSNTLLLLGVMLGSMVSAAVMVLLASARPEMLAEFLSWQFGSYRGTTREALGTLAPILGVALLISFLLGPWMNVLQLGDRYAATMGVHVTAVRVGLIALTAVLAGATTAYCGPIQFLGMAVPHIARQVFRTADQRLLLPVTALTGAALAVSVDLLATLPGGEVLPLNAANAAVGAPIVIWVLIRNARRGESS